MAARVMVIWSLMLLLLWAAVYLFFTHFFNDRHGIEYERKRAQILERKVNSQMRQIAKLELKFSEYKDAIAAAGVKIDNTKWTDPKRAIASVISDPQYKHIPQPQPGNYAFKKARKMFVTGDYRRAAELLEDFTQKYPDHPSLPEAAYLLSECAFHLDQLELSVKMIDFILTHFPETEYAAYGLLRLANILEKQERIEEAADIYNTVMANFPNSNSAFVARKNLKELNL